MTWLFTGPWTLLNDLSVNRPHIPRDQDVMTRLFIGPWTCTAWPFLWYHDVMTQLFIGPWTCTAWPFLWYHDVMTRLFIGPWTCTAWPFLWYHDVMTQLFKRPQNLQWKITFQLCFFLLNDILPVLRLLVYSTSSVLSLKVPSVWLGKQQETL